MISSGGFRRIAASRRGSCVGLQEMPSQANCTRDGLVVAALCSRGGASNALLELVALGTLRPQASTAFFLGSGANRMSSVGDFEPAARLSGLSVLLPRDLLKELKR